MELVRQLSDFIVTRGDKVTQFFAGITTAMGAFSVSDWGIIFGIFLGLASFVLTWIFKWKNHKLLEKSLNVNSTVGAILREDEF